MNENTQDPNVTDAEVIEEILPEETESNAEFIEVNPEPEMVEESPDQTWFYYIANIKIYYLRDKRLKERNVNILITLAHPRVNYQAIRSAQQSAMGRIRQENKVEVKDMKDAVIESVSFLGEMTTAQWEATENLVGLGGKEEGESMEADRASRT